MRRTRGFPCATGGSSLSQLRKPLIVPGIIPAPGSSFLIYDPRYVAARIAAFIARTTYMTDPFMYAREAATRETVSIRGIFTGECFVRYAADLMGGWTDAAREIQRKLLRVNCTVAIGL